MGALIIVAVLFATLFFVSFITKRRFGVLGLALAAGAVLSTHWADTLTPLLEKQGVVLVAPPLGIVVQSVLILAPAFLLLFSGPGYNKPMLRIIGSLAFAALGVVFLANVLASSLILDGPSKAFFTQLHTYQSLIIVVGIIGALVDVLLTRKPKGRGGKGKKE